MRILLCLLLLALSTTAMQSPLSNCNNLTKRTPSSLFLEKVREGALRPFHENVIKPSYREEHLVENPNIEHYSIYRTYSVTTYIEDNTPELFFNHYIARTISNYPKEGIRIMYSGIIEMQKKICGAIMPQRAECPTDPIACADAEKIFKHYIVTHKLHDKTKQEWLKEIANKQQPSLIKIDNTP